MNDLDDRLLTTPGTPTVGRTGRVTGVDVPNWYAWLPRSCREGTLRSG